MTQNEILNIIIAGTGGQGVVKLTKLIKDMALNSSYKCEGATFKGGAQRLGSVYSELRILTQKNKDEIFSSQIPIGEVDVLIGLEPWEALRFANKCNKRTKLIVNSKEEKLYVERFKKEKTIDVIESLEALFTDITIIDYTGLSNTITGSRRNMNILMLQDALEKQILPFSTKDLEGVIND